MIKKRIIKKWFEEDVHTKWRRLYTSYKRAGKAKKDKNLTNRRERREAVRDINEQLD